MLFNMAQFGRTCCTYGDESWWCGVVWCGVVVQTDQHLNGGVGGFAAT